MKGYIKGKKAILFLGCLFLCLFIGGLRPASAFQLGDDISLNGYAEFYGVMRQHPNSSPVQDPTYTLGLDWNQKFGSVARFRSIVTGVWDGTVLTAYDRDAFVEYHEMFQDKRRYIDPEEVYLDLYLKSMDVRLGIQKFTWGRMVEINPTDNLNPEDLHEFYLPDENDRKIGVPAAQVKYYNDFGNLEIDWIPRYVPPRVPDLGERWFFPVSTPPPTISTGLGEVPVTANFHDVRLPDFSLSHSEIGLRFTKMINGMDVSVSYFNGYDPRPSFRGEAVLDGTVKDPQITADLYPSLHRIHVFGGDFSTTFGAFTVRGEAAYYHNRYHLRNISELIEEYTSLKKQLTIAADAAASGKGLYYYDAPETEVQKDSLEAGLGVDYLLDPNMTLMFQIIQDRIMDYDDSKKLIYNQWENYFMAGGQFYFWDRALLLEVPVIYSIPKYAYIYKPSLNYNLFDRLKLTLGLVIIDGNDSSLIGQFYHNDEFFAKLRYSF